MVLSPANRGRIVDLTAKRTYLAEASAEEVRKAGEAITSFQEQIDALADGKTRPGVLKKTSRVTGRQENPTGKPDPESSKKPRE